MKHFFAQMLLGFSLVLVPSIAKCDDFSAEWELVLKTIESERNKIISGSVTIKGTGEFVDQSEKPRDAKSEGFIDQWHTSIFYAFEKDRFRYERSNEQHKTTPIKVFPNTANPKDNEKDAGLIPTKSFYIKNGNKSYWWTSDGNSIFVQNDSESSKAVIDFLDVKSLGLFTLDSYAKKATLEQNLKTFRKLTSFIKKLEKRDDGLWVFTIVVSNMGTTATMAISFDSLNDFNPVSIETSAGSSYLFGFSKKFTESHSTKWEKFGSVFVPVQFTVTSPKKNGTYKNTVNLTWENVNQTVDPHFFKLESIPAPPGVGILNIEAPKETYVKPVNFDEILVSAEKPKPDNSFLIFGIAALVTILCIFVFIFIIKTKLKYRLAKTV